MNTKITYREKLRDPRWQKVRLEILNRDGWACTNCGNEKEELQVHHEEYRGEPWQARKEKLKTLCKSCHERISKSPYAEDLVNPYPRLLWCGVAHPETIPIIAGVFRALGIDDEFFELLDEEFSESMTTARILEMFRDHDKNRVIAHAAISEVEMKTPNKTAFILRAVAALIDELDAHQGSRQ